MKVLQTLGKHGGAQEGIFQYKRTALGVHIDYSVGRIDPQQPQQILITNNDWCLLLEELQNMTKTTFSLSSELYQFISKVKPKLSSLNGIPLSDSIKASIAAILEHEGTLDLYGGPRGKTASATITLSKK